MRPRRDRHPRPRRGGGDATASRGSISPCSGQFPYSACPSVPAEMMLLPRWFYFNIYAMSAWSRTIVVPLSDRRRVQAGDARCPESMRIRELFLQPPETPRWPAKPTKQWLLVDQLLPRHRLAAQEARAAAADPLRRRAVRKAAAWMRERCERQRRPRRHLPADDLHAIVPASASACRTTTRRCDGR